MDTQLDAVNRQIQQEKDRYNRTINDLDRKKLQAKTQHDQTMRMLNSRKEQIKRSMKLENMEETLNKALEG